MSWRIGVGELVVTEGRCIADVTHRLNIFLWLVGTSGFGYEGAPITGVQPDTQQRRLLPFIARRRGLFYCYTVNGGCCGVNVGEAIFLEGEQRSVVDVDENKTNFRFWPCFAKFFDLVYAQTEVGLGECSVLSCILFPSSAFISRKSRALYCV